jgi:DNA adenine methylase
LTVHRRDITPIVRWAGGKRWLIPHIAALAEVWKPTSFFEPFAGGAAIYLGFHWPEPTISDINEDLMATYRGIAKNHRAVEVGLSPLKVCRAEYDRQKGASPVSDVDRAIRLLYLNRCGYGGIYRTDRHGNFNVPFSGDRGTQSLWKDDRLARLSEALHGARMMSGDFESTLADAGPGSLIYCDPAYALPEATRVFRRYSPAAFAWKDQQRLAAVVQELRGRGALIVVSNSSDSRVADLFSGALVRTFDRRVPFPKANGERLKEAMYILGEPKLLASLRTQMACRSRDGS